VGAPSSAVPPQVSVDDVAVTFTQEEWGLALAQRMPYHSVMLETCRHLASLAGGRRGPVDAGASTSRSLEDHP
uniref:KRAB domain-containing protein n=1 Tax=Sciurus vulgaris TaxID=55149 RepID=A0A8D2JNW6_SCIVU